MHLGDTRAVLNACSGGRAAVCSGSGCYPFLWSLGGRFSPDFVPCLGRYSNQLHVGGGNSAVLAQCSPSVLPCFLKSMEVGVALLLYSLSVGVAVLLYLLDACRGGKPAVACSMLACGDCYAASQVAVALLLCLLVASSGGLAAVLESMWG